jgi:Fe(3+) dicitrate transport protein
MNKNRSHLENTEMQLGKSCFVLLMLLLTVSPQISASDCDASTPLPPSCTQLEPITIFGSADRARDVAGGASIISAEELEQFENSDVVRALRRVPGVSMQLEDGWALRPNISIRGTATERSSRITLMEDGVLIAPAPYSAPSAYYFPTFGRINSVEILKGPASITQGPYTVGGAINLSSTPIPASNQGLLQGEFGSDSTWRVHGWYGGSSERLGYLAETHQWQSDGYQTIDRSKKATGLQKQDYLAKLAIYSDPASSLYQSLELKLQYSEEDSQQSYLGLTDVDFKDQPLRRYGLSAEDEMHNEHDQITLSWRIENQEGSGLSVTAYNNDFERAWYKTEAFDFNGSASPQSFSGTGWANIVDAINRGLSLGILSPDDLQAILDGADTAVGSIQLRNNSRKYYSRGIQAVADTSLNTGSASHKLQVGVRLHEDEEDRLQRNDNYQQLAGQLLLNSIGLQGNAGNQLQDAEAWAVYIQDRIELGAWTFTPGLRYENIKLKRTRYFTNSVDPSSRDQSNFRDSRENRVDIWLPGMGAIYAINNNAQLVAGIHRGFSTPGNETGVDPEESTNYELGIRQQMQDFGFEAMLFYNDYENLVGVCTNSSGSDCEPGSAFNGDGVHIPGLEFTANANLNSGAEWEFPLQLTYTWMNPEFQTSFISEFFGEVHKGDPVPYIPENQLWASAGLLHGPWAFYLSGNYLDSICTQASCDEFERVDSALLFDVSAHYEINTDWTVYALVENLTDQLEIVAREPYGARAGKPRTFMLGTTFNF